MRQAYFDRMTLSETVELVGKLLDGFPHGRPPNQTSYIGALAAVLCEYPRTVVVNVGHPTKGVARETKFLPTVSDLVGWCERETTFLRGAVDREDREEALQRERERRRQDDEAQTAARAVRPSLDDLRSKYGPNWGLKTIDGAAASAKAAHLSHVAEGNRREFERECAEAGIDPDSGVSPSLRKLLREQRPAAPAAE